MISKNNQCVKKIAIPEGSSIIHGSGFNNPNLTDNYIR